jgi:hypothetical protein
VSHFVRWLTSRALLAASCGNPIDTARAVRTSSSDVEQWKASATTSFAALEREKDPDVVKAISYGMDLVSRDAAGEVKRAELGDAVFELRMCHARGGVGARRIGVVLHVGRTLFVYLLTSARADNLEAETDDRRGNAATEILSEVLRQMSAVGRGIDPGYRPKVHAREHERIIRDERHGTALKETFIACDAIAFLPSKFDLRDLSQQSGFSFGTLLSAAAVEGLVRGMNRAEVVLQANGGYYSSIQQVPFTHEPAHTIETDVRTGVQFVSTNKHRLAVAADVDGTRSILRAVVDEVLKNRVDQHGIERDLPDWNAVAGLPEVMALRSRLGYDLRRGITLGQKPMAARVHSLKSLLSERWIEGLRSGWITVDVPIKTRLDLDLGDAVQIIARGKKQYYRCRVALPLPQGGWGITEAEWDEVLRRRYPGVRRTPTDNCHPLAGVSWDDVDNDREYRLATRNRYLVQSRQLSRTGSVRGGRCGWDEGPQVRHEATITSYVLHTDVATAAREALIGLDTPAAPLVLRRLSTLARAEQQQFDADIRMRLTNDLEDARGTEEEATLERIQTKARLKKAEHRGDQADIVDSRRKLEVAEKVLAKAEADVHAATSALDDYDRRTGAPSAPSSAEEAVEVQTATPEFVVAALEKCPGVGPLWLQVTCSTMFTGWDFRVIRQTGARDRVAWSCDMHLQLEGSDDTVVLPLSGEVASNSNASGTAAATTTEDLAWRFFYGAQSFAEVGRAAGVDGSGKKNSFLYKRLFDWLSPAIPDPTLRNAALACPVPATRRLFWVMVTGNADALAGIDDGFAQHIAAVYGQPAWRAKWSWCRDTHTNARRVAAALVAAGGRSPVHEILRAVKISYDELLATARENGKTTTGTDQRVTQPRAVGYFGKTFKRGAPTVAPDDRQIFLRACPHADCPERLAGRAAHASLVVNVPETEQWHAVICPACMRVPDTRKAAVRFPSDYARPWAGHYGTRSTLSGARSQQHWTFADPTFPDPGPGTPLPDTGAMPRTAQLPPTRSPSARAPMRGTPLGGQRVLPLNLDQQQIAAFNQRLTDLGGTRGQRLKASLAAVIVASTQGTCWPQAVRAATLGVPVLTLEEFSCWEPADNNEHAVPEAA